MKSDDQVEIQLAIELDGGYRVVRCRVDEAASEVTHAVIEIATNEDIDFAAPLGQTAELTIVVGGLVARRWTLVVGSIAFSRVEQGTMRYDVHLHARPWLARHTLETRKFREMSAKDVVSAVLGAHGVALRWQITRDPRVRSYTAQYAESNLAFASRLLEFEGIYYTFDEDGVMVLEDRSAAAAEVEALVPIFDMLDAAGALTKGAVGVLEARRVARVAPGRATVNDFNWKTPKTKLLTSETAERDRELDVYTYPEGFREPDEGKLLARMRLEAHRAPAITLDGAANVAAFAPGRRFSFTGAGDPSFAGDYFLVRVEHEARDVSFFADAGSGDDAPYKNRFRAIPADVPFRPALVTPRPKLEGTHTAMVRGPAGEEIHTDTHGRMKVQFHWDRNAKKSDEDSRWIRMVQENQTSQHLARVGWEMNVGYIDGDPDRPVSLSRKINGAMPPAYAQPAEKNSMTMKTPSSPSTGGFNELKLRDDAADMLFFVQAERDHTTSIKNDKSEEIARDETRKVLRNLRRATGRDQTLTIGGNSKEHIVGNRTLKVHADRKRTVLGSEKVHVKQALTLTTVDNETEKVGGVRMTFTGGFKMPDIKALGEKALTNLKSQAQKELVTPVVDAAKAGAKDAWSKGGGFGGLTSDAGGMIGGVVSGAAGAAMSKAGSGLLGSFASSAKDSVLSDLTGGLSKDFSLQNAANMFLIGSIQRTATEKMKRTVGGAFISVGISDFIVTTGNTQQELIGGLKLTATVREGITQSAKDMMYTVIGAAIRTSTKDTLSTADFTIVNVGAALDIKSSKQVHIKSKAIVVVGLSALDFVATGATLGMTPASISMTGSVQITAGQKVVMTGSTNEIGS